MWLYKFAYLKSGLKETVYIRSQRLVVFDNLFAQEDCCASAFRKITIYRPMNRLPVLVVMPILIALGRKYRVFYGEDESASRSQAVIDFSAYIRKGFEIMEG